MKIGDFPSCVSFRSLMLVRLMFQTSYGVYSTLSLVS